jgi:hypothetical protein
MLERQFELEQVDPILQQIYEGVAVHDRTGRRIGTVEYVYLGEVAGSLIEEFAKAVLLTERVPDIWRERLLSYGFIRINRFGLFTADRYALPSQIAGVVDDRVLLNVDLDELLKG